ncbi:MAG: DUF721 domain-containing protein [Acidobacteriaceae bacterium]|nr:DUF721 domain-containing protein [Acidobacteriaceae bacterium]MBV9779692.1 DUF721 domain-containing protein [Acidobacteriaceae bacterium]
MERVARLVKNAKFTGKFFADEDLARAIWPAAVGKAISSHTSRITLVRSKLVVEVEDTIWQQQLYRLSAQIMERLRKITGTDRIQELEFRITVPRIQAHREERDASGTARGTAKFGS